jgi:hypothetical protein
MRVCGIDYSSHAVDIVTVPLEADGAPEWTRYELKGADAFERTRDVSNAMPGAHSAMWDSVIAVGIEHPAGRYGTGPLMRLQGSVLAMIPSRMLVEPLPPAKWRKLVGLPGNASKDDVKNHAYWHVGDAFTRYRFFQGKSPAAFPQDACDALCIALATRQLLEHPEAA